MSDSLIKFHDDDFKGGPYDPDSSQDYGLISQAPYMLSSHFQGDCTQ